MRKNGKSIEYLIICVLCFGLISCQTTKTVSTQPAIDASNATAKIEVYVDKQKESLAKSEEIEALNKTYTDKIKDLADEAIASDEYYKNEARKEGFNEGWNSYKEFIEPILREHNIEVIYEKDN